MKLSRRYLHNYLAFIGSVFLLLASLTVSGVRPVRAEASKAETALLERLNGAVKSGRTAESSELFPKSTEILAVEIDDETVLIRFSRHVGRNPVCSETLSRMETFFRPLLGDSFGGRELRFFLDQVPLEALIPRRLETSLASAVSTESATPLVRMADSPAPQPTAGLFGRHLVVSPSHGWMYDAEKSLRWEWQRPRLFTTVEDLLSVSYVLPFLIPMLERAGAVVFCPRERDWQFHEVILDNEDGESRRLSAGVVEMNRIWKRSDEPGFRSGLDPYPDGLNPHREGTVHLIATRDRVTAKIEWVPNIPETGEYGVSVSYHASPDRPSDARYTIYHMGGTTSFLVNQKMAGNTWVWLGRFRFEEGMRRSQGRVELNNFSTEPGAIVCADAVKFGGGMGDVLRGGETSGYPRYAEGSRYYLQYAGAPADLVYQRGYTTGYEGPDYVDDYTCRPEWANYLRGAPCGPNDDRTHPGLGVPLDLYFSLHTDAGSSNGLIGTLAIFYTKDQNYEEVFPDGRSRFLNRELAELVQTQIVEDVRALYVSSWPRRWLYNEDYAETRRANIPSCMIELLSHQNFNDLRYGLDPRFRRDAARAMYKGILRFLAKEHGFQPMVQPLPPTHLTVRQIGAESVQVTWRPQEDPLEPSARPTGYIVYRRVGDGGFDNGTYTNEDRLAVSGLEPGVVHSFRVEAVNQGGRSFPSETLAVAVGEPQIPRALIVCGFDRLGPPSSVNVPGYQGFDRMDRGVGYLFNFGLCGDQYDFDPESEFVTNDRPGHGASAGDMEGRLELGNAFDYVARHGQALVACGWGFDSVSDEAVEAGLVNLNNYVLVDWILGEQRTERVPAGVGGAPDRLRPMFKTFTPPLQSQLRKYVRSGGALLVSGAYVGTDLADDSDNPTADGKFLEEVLHIAWVTNHGSSTNVLLPQKGETFEGLEGLRFSRGYGEDGIYGVELPDAIDPAKGSNARTVLRYADRRFSAGVIHESTETNSRTMVLGFPFETIVGSDQRAQFLERALEFLRPDQ